MQDPIQIDLLVAVDAHIRFFRAKLSQRKVHLPG
jgi:hypothetical protein